MAKVIRFKIPVVFRLHEDGDHLMIGSQDENSMNLAKGGFYERYQLW